MTRLALAPGDGDAPYGGCWSKMPLENRPPGREPIVPYDVVTIGGGFAGLITANRCAELGLIAAELKLT